MKSITITYDETNSNLNLASQGFTDAEVLVILEEAHDKVHATVVDALKKKNTGLLTPHLAHPFGRG